MTFTLFGFDFFPKDKIYGFWIGGIKNPDKEQNRHLLGICFNDGEWIATFLYFQVIGY